VVADVAARVFGVDADEALEGLVEREAAGSTGVGEGVAIPHARLDGLDRVRAVFMRLDTPVAFGAVDDKPVDLLVALFAPQGRRFQPPAGPGPHLAADAPARNPREQLRKARSADAVHVLLTQAHESKPTAA
jgi:PTS system nitrogen regulatory IIA component